MCERPVTTFLHITDSGNPLGFEIDVPVMLPPPGCGRSHYIRKLVETALGPIKPAPKAKPPPPPPPDGLRTPAEAARKLRCSIKTLNGHVASGALRYVDIGHGRKRPRRMFTDADLNEFIANQTRKDSPACRSIASRARRSSTSNSASEVIAFTGQPRPRPGAKPKK